LAPKSKPPHRRNNEIHAGHDLQPAAGGDAVPPRAGTGSLRRAHCPRRLPLRHAVLPRTGGAETAGDARGAGSGFKSNPTFDRGAGGAGLDSADRATGGNFHRFFPAINDESHSAFRAELRLPHLTSAFSRP
jgi:hypothetical protein